MEDPIVAEGSDLILEVMRPEDKPEMDMMEFLGRDPKFAFNDQGSANWFKDRYPHFPDHVYEVLEMYSKHGIRYKEFRNHLKKLKMKGKLIIEKGTPEAVLQFKKLSIEEEK